MNCKSNERLKNETYNKIKCISILYFCIYSLLFVGGTIKNFFGSKIIKCNFDIRDFYWLL